jgi:hypothetical protein
MNKQRTLYPDVLRLRVKLHTKFPPSQGAHLPEDGDTAVRAIYWYPSAKPRRRIP